MLSLDLIASGGSLVFALSNDRAVIAALRWESSDTLIILEALISAFASCGYTIRLSSGLERLASSLSELVI